MIKRILICFLIVFFQNVYSQNITENDSIKYPTTIEILEKHKISNYETLDFSINSEWKINEIEKTITQLEGAYNELGSLLKSLNEKESRKPYLILKSNNNSKITIAKSKIRAEKATADAEKATADAEKATADAEKAKRQAEVSTEIVRSLKKGESQIKKEK